VEYEWERDFPFFVQDSSMTSAKLALVVLLIPMAAPASAPPKPATEVETIACRAMEAGVSTGFGVRIVIFHYRDAADRNRLGQLLRKYNGATVRFETQGGSWRPATLLRLKTCFGRGLLVVASSAPPLAHGDDFLIQFPLRVQN
jgi:hypothetical protein